MLWKPTRSTGLVTTRAPVTSSTTGPPAGAASAAPSIVSAPPGQGRPGGQAQRPAGPRGQRGPPEAPPDRSLPLHHRPERVRVERVPGHHLCTYLLTRETDETTRCWDRATRGAAARPSGRR